MKITLHHAVTIFNYLRIQGRCSYELIKKMTDEDAEKLIAEFPTNRTDEQKEALSKKYGIHNGFSLEEALKR